MNTTTTQEKNAAQETNGTPPLVCPQCKDALELGFESYRCERDQLDFPVVLGIPDFRMLSERERAQDVEGRKARQLSEEYGRRDFAELLRLYYDLSPEVPKPLVQRYLLHAESALGRAETTLASIHQESGRSAELPSQGGPFIEVGCGTGGFLVAASREYPSVTGVDIEMSWLVLAQKLLDESGRDARLVCASGEHLPFTDGAFQLAVSRDVIEHVSDQVAVTRETYRTLAPGGVLFMATPNRWSLGLEPHVRVWGVGFLPKAWRERYVRFVNGASFKNVETLNYFGMRRLLRESGVSRWQVTLPKIPNDHLVAMSRIERAIVPVYHALKDVPPVSWVAYMFGPLFHVVCMKPAQLAATDK